MSKTNNAGSPDHYGEAWAATLAEHISGLTPCVKLTALQAVICAAASMVEEAQPGLAARYLRIVADELDRETKPPRQLDEETADDPAKAEPQTRAIILAAENADLARQVNAAKRETRKKTAELGAALELYETMKAEKEAKA